MVKLALLGAFDSMNEVEFCRAVRMLEMDTSLSREVLQIKLAGMVDGEFDKLRDTLKAVRPDLYQKAFAVAA